ncbi:hypothetical protein [Sphingomonas sp. J315]|nr:hypothetical protein [Sphingomonas sp. J315]UUX99155.1 hypothetical protein LRS08_17000 [Sphingomonas sp. J315]
MKSIFFAKYQTLTHHQRSARPPLTFLARRTADDLRAAAVARAAVLEVIG